MSPANASSRFTTAGFSVLWISLFALAIGVAASSIPLVLVGLVLFVVLASVRKTSAKNMGAVALRRQLPKRALAGRSFVIEAELSGTGGYPLADLTLLDPIGTGLPPTIDLLQPKASRSFPYLARIDRRGMHRLPLPALRSTWPYQFTESERKLTESELVSEQLVRVLPAPFLPGKLSQHLDGLLRGPALSPLASDPSAEFRTLREFEPGDPVRRIHWHSSLKSDQLLVREVDPPNPSPRRYGIILHSLRTEKTIVTPEEFEILLRLTSGLFRKLREGNLEVRFLHLPHPPRILRRSSDFDALLDEFAIRECCPIPDLSALNDLSLFDSCDEVFALGEGDSDDWQEALETAIGPIHAVDAHSVNLARRPRLRTQTQRAS